MAFNVTGVVGPLGRRTTFTYANGIDLLAVSQITEGGFATVLGQYTYNYLHRPLTYTDAAGGRSRHRARPGARRLRAALSLAVRPCTTRARCCRPTRCSSRRPAARWAQRHSRRI
ncbi:MAG: hypothetical protein KF889_05205 [Alphaproteobacteria bacterium]|nr:hypothetical protein [Alphaproteobacteria bacterium]